LATDPFVEDSSGEHNKAGLPAATPPLSI